VEISNNIISQVKTQTIPGYRGKRGALFPSLPRWEGGCSFSGGWRGRFYKNRASCALLL